MKWETAVRRYKCEKFVFWCCGSNTQHLFYPSDSFASTANWTEGPLRNSTYRLTWYPKIVWQWNSILREMKTTYCCVRFSFKRLQWLRLLQMTVDGFPLRKVVLNFFVYSVTSCQPELSLQLMMGFNPDTSEMLMVNSYCFWAACLPCSRCWWVTFWLIWQDSPGGITASYLSEDYRIICVSTDNYLSPWMT